MAVVEILQTDGSAFLYPSDADQLRLLATLVELDGGRWTVSLEIHSNFGSVSAQAVSETVDEFISDHPTRHFTNLVGMLQWLIEVLDFCQKPNHPMLAVRLSEHNVATRTALEGLVKALPQHKHKA
ncbi:TPA: hypothetical protein DCQ44_01460 [Candidatus Taylorbacteria bacterium]|nr:hypothetical protein [Candidatus Taylorbacteria bacterium]